MIGTYPLIFAGTISTIQAQFFGKFKNYTQEFITILIVNLLILGVSIILPDLGILNSMRFPSLHSEFLSVPLNFLLHALLHIDKCPGQFEANF